MSTEDETDNAPVSVTDEPEPAEAEADAETAPPKRKLEIEVAITDVGPCKKHLKITIPRRKSTASTKSRSKSCAKTRWSRAFGPARRPSN